MRLTQLVVLAMALSMAAPVRAATAGRWHRPMARFASTSDSTRAGALSYRVALAEGTAQADVLAWSPLGVTARRPGVRHGTSLHLRGRQARHRRVVRGAARQTARESGIARPSSPFSFTNAGGAPFDVIVRRRQRRRRLQRTLPNPDPSVRQRPFKEESQALPCRGAKSWIAPRSPARKYTPGVPRTSTSARRRAPRRRLAAGMGLPGASSMRRQARWALRDRVVRGRALRGGPPRGRGGGRHVPAAATGQAEGQGSDRRSPRRPCRGRFRGAS